jgi:hypothetical protein
MRVLVEPPSLLRCILCDGEVRLKQVEVANRSLGLYNQICVCVICDREQSYTVSHHNPTHMATWPTNTF